MQILLVEDNPADVVLIRQCLTTALPAADIRVAMDGEQAVAMLCDPDLVADLVILDLNIPKIPGISVLSQCQPRAPVIVFSSSSNPAEIRRAKELGVREFVQKPIDLEEFDRVVKRMIQDWAKSRRTTTCPAKNSCVAPECAQPPASSPA
jgi:DNA-binding NarL/FixJ family response regulator